MSPLWRKINNQIINLKRPSPNYEQKSSSLARGDKIICNETPSYRMKQASIKGISVFVFLGKRVLAGMTVEAALVLPLFLFFFLNLSSMIEVIRLHGNIELALWKTGREMAVYGNVLIDPEEEPKFQELMDIGVSYTYGKESIVRFLGKNYLEESPLSNGIESLQFWESELFTENGCFDLILTYQVSPLLKLLGFPAFRLSNRYYGRLWNGYSLALENDSTVQMVYITETGRVYHENRECTHLLLSIEEVTVEQALYQKNGQGERYKPCEKCVGSGGMESVFITKEGARYHFRIDCSSLKRTILLVEKSTCTNKTACKRCVKES